MPGFYLGSTFTPSDRFGFCGGLALRSGLRLLSNGGFCLASWPLGRTGFFAQQVRGELFKMNDHTVYNQLDIGEGMAVPKQAEVQAVTVGQ